jgi:hypothetical protein
MKLFCSAPQFSNSLITYMKNVAQNVDHLKFGTDLIEGLMVKYSMQHRARSTW